MPRQSDQRLSPRQRRGFTLMELLLVVAVVTIVGGLSGGLYVNSYKRLLVEKTARQFLLTARYARIMAIEQQRPYELQLDAGNQGFLLATTRWDQQTGQASQEAVKDYYCRPVLFEGEVKFEDVKITTLTAPAAGQETETEQEQKIVFRPNGTADSAVVQIGDGKTHYTVAIVASTGKATLDAGLTGEVKTAAIDLDAQ